MSLRKFNNILSFIVILLGIYITLIPFLPEISYTLEDNSPETQAPYSGNLAKAVGSSSNEKPEGNRIVIPSIHVNEPILEGSNIWVINQGGTWRRPNSANPTENNNTVIVGHRFYGNKISTFYHLDKVQKDQLLAVYWDGEEILYQVTEKKVVSADAVEIEAPTSEKQLTLYTCDPIWTAKNRLVIIAKPTSEEINEEN